MVDNKKLGSIGLKAFWIKIFSLVSLITGNVDVIGKGDLQTQIDSMSEKVDQCFTSASNGKAAIASAITGKGVNTASDATFATMAANIGNIKTSPRLQAKNVALSTAAQTIKPDTGYDGLSQVSVPAVSGNAGTGDVLANKTFSSGSAGISKTGTLADKTGTTDYSAEASIDVTNKRIKLKVPATGKYGVGNYLYAAYTTIANLIGLTAAKLVKGNTILGITGSNNNMDTSGADAGAGDILAGKKAGVKGSLIIGTMPNKGAWTGATTGNGNVVIPAGYHNGQGHVSGAGAYNAGVSAADGRVNADSANYRGGYNAGVSATKKGTAGAGDVLSGKTFTNGSSVGASGTMPNKGAWTGATTGSGNVTIPAGYHNGQGHVSGAGAYNKGVTDADARVNANSANYKGGYNAGVSAADGRVNADSANYKGGYNAGVSATKKGTAGAGDVLSGKTFTNSSNVETSGTMANKGSTTQDATATQDDTYTYLTVPVAGYYNTASKLRTKNSNLGTDSFFGLPFTLSRQNSAAGTNQGSTNTARLYLNGKYKNISLTASGHITSSSSTGLKVTISANNGTETTELYTTTNTGSNKEKDYSIVIPARTEYIEITVYHGSTGQYVSYEVRLDSLTVS